MAAISLETDVAKAKNPPKKLPRVITSFNEAGYEQYGRNFIASWQKYAPRSIGLTVYYEGEKFDFTDGISWHPFESVEFLKDYLDNLRFPIQHGIVGDKFDMWFDARQGRKAFMEMHAMRQYGGKVFWIDADTLLHDYMPERFLDECLPDEKLACYIGRHTADFNYWYHTESGFIGFNGGHPLAARFAKNYLHTFITGTIFANYFFNRPGWNDCCAFDAVRHVIEVTGECVNLAANVPQGTMHPLQNCAPGKYLTHLKGDRKNTGKLKEGDIVIPARH